jgi:F-type H+-transporting ATPase subunit epsilon
MADQLHVELVSADSVVWSGEASEVLARTVEGELGILRGHTPLLSLLAESEVEIVPAGGQAGQGGAAAGARVRASIDGGFISVANDRVSILSEHVTLA